MDSRSAQPAAGRDPRAATEALGPAPASATRVGNLPLFAWWTGLAAAALTAVGTLLLIRFGQSGPTTGIYVSSVLAGVAGAAIAARHPRNPVGWLLIIATAITALFILTFDYGYGATAGGAAALPLSTWALWLASWLWVVPFGISMAAVLIRLPDGHVRPGWRFVDAVMVAGTATLVAGIAVAPGPMYPLGLTANPIGLAAGAGPLAVLRDLGFLLIGVGMTAAVASVLVRLRSARGDEFQQLEWIAFGAGIVATSVLLGGVLVAFFHVGFTQALTPFGIAVLGMPLAVGVAMLRYRLYDVDVIINRTLVYGGLTAILAGFYAALVTVGQRFFISATGQRSDAAVVIGAFAVASVFTPVRDGLQGLVSRYVSPRSPKTLLRRLQESVNAVVAVLDGETVARRLLNDAASGYGARFGALYLNQQGAERLIHQVGPVGPHPGVEIAIGMDGNALGRLVLGERHGGIAYSREDVQTLQVSAEAIARALVLADRLDAGRVSLTAAGGDG